MYLSGGNSQRYNRALRHARCYQDSKMNFGIRLAFWIFAAAATVFACHVSARLYQFSTYSMAFSDEPEAASYPELFRYAAYVDTPGRSFNACINNLRQLDGAIQQWALEHPLSVTNDTVVTWKDIEPYIKVGPSGRLWCPRGGRYKIGRVCDPPVCSIKSHKLP
jgi:hypothetical protein